MTTAPTSRISKRIPVARGEPAKLEIRSSHVRSTKRKIIIHMPYRRRKAPGYLLFPLEHVWMRSPVFARGQTPHHILPNRRNAKGSRVHQRPQMTRVAMFLEAWTVPKKAHRRTSAKRNNRAYWKRPGYHRDRINRPIRGICSKSILDISSTLFFTRIGLDRYHVSNILRSNECNLKSKYPFSNSPPLMGGARGGWK